MNELPNPREVSERLLALRFVFLYASAIQPTPGMADEVGRMSEEEKETIKHANRMRKEAAEDFRRQAKEDGFWSVLTERERAFADTDLDVMPSQDHKNYLWKIESYQALLWALNGIDVMPPFYQRADIEILTIDLGPVLSQPLLRDRNNEWDKTSFSIA